MNRSRLLIVVLGAALVAALGAVFWQARLIAGLRTETAGLRQDLQQTLSVVLDTAPASGLDQARRERLELIQLRHETRQLRESLVDAHARRPGGWKGMLKPLLPAEAPQLAPEWKALGQNASNQYAQVMQNVNNGTNEFLRFLWLHRAAKMSLALSRPEDARQYAEDALTLNEKYSRGEPEKLRGDVVHDANVVLGRLDLGKGRMEEAKRRLLAAGRSTGSPLLSTFGPNMMLAKELIERGEQATVLEYFVLCRQFWKDATLDTWQKDVEAGRMPDFGASLIR